MMRYLILLIFLSTWSFTSLAQPGYMGKKTNITYHFSYVPVRSTYPTYNRMEEDGYRAQKKHELEVERVIARKTGLAIGYQYFRTAYFYDVKVYDDFGYYNYEQYLDKIQVSKIGLTFYFYSKAPGIAPLGNRYGLGLGYLHASSITTETLMTDFSKSTPVIDFSFGKKVVFFDKITVNYNASINVPLFVFGTVEEYEYDDNREYNLTRRVLAAYIFDFKIGIGLLTK